MRSLRVLLLVLAVVLISSPPGKTQTFSQPLDATLSSCDQSLLQQIAVPGINAAWIGKHMYSNPLIPSLGFATTDMTTAIDPTVANYMNLNGLPGGAVAITYKNHLIFAKSYGYVDVDNALFAAPDSRFRVASVSKAITAMGILKLVHDGQLSLNDRPFPFPGVGSVIGGAYNRALSPPSGPTVDEMLHHAGGWDRDIGPDLMGYDTLHTVEGLIPSSSAPPDCTNLLRYVESQPLQFRPGTRVDYSNVGFCALSEVIRETSGGSYMDYMQKNVLSPLGMNDTTLGSTQQSKQQDREAVYYDATDRPLPSLFAPFATVPPPYSNIGALEAQQGGGGLVTTAIDLAHFTGAIASGNLPNFPGPPAFPGWPQMYYTLSTRLPSYETPDTAVGAGWDAVPSNVVAKPLLPYDNYNFVKEGGYEGTVSVVAATADGYGFAAVFNGGDNTAPGPDGQIFWPGCNTPPPLPASKNGNCALQAAYNHEAKQPWNIDFSPQYSQGYSSWMSELAFKNYLDSQRTSGFYPSRLEGRATASGGATVFEYRGRFGQQAAPKFLYGQPCAAVVSAVQSASSSTPLVNLQRFRDSTGTYVYQAVWSAPISTTGAQTPQINSGGIVIHAGTSPAVSPGSLVDIYGTNLAEAPQSAPGGAALPTTLGGVQVLVNSTAAPLIYVSPLQTIFQVPYETALGTASVIVVWNGISSASAPLTVQPAAPFILTYGSSNNRAVVVNPDGTVNGAGNGATPGAELVAYLIGSGPLDNPIATGAPALSSPLSQETLSTTVLVGGSKAEVKFAGMAPGFVGLVQLNFVVPNLNPGDYSLQVAIGGATSNQPLVTVSNRL